MASAWVWWWIKEKFISSREPGRNNGDSQEMKSGGERRVKETSRVLSRAPGCKGSQNLKSKSRF